MKSVIVGVSGGDFVSTGLLNEYAIQCTGKENPKVLFIPTASKDSQSYIESIEAYYRGLHCSFSALCLTKKPYEKEEIEEMIQHADLIYVGGGDTESMIELWKKYGVDTIILDAYREGKVFTGISAGAMFWFRKGFSDSANFKNEEVWNYKFIDCLNLFPYVFCPHYEEEGRDSFDERIKEIGMDGIALDNDIAIVIENNHIYIKKARPDASAYLLKNVEGVYKKIEFTEDIIL